MRGGQMAAATQATLLVPRCIPTRRRRAPHPPAHRATYGSRLRVTCDAKDKAPPPPPDAEQRLELLEKQLGKQYDPASRPKSERPQVQQKLEPWSKRLEGKEPAEALWMLWTGEEGVLWWANKIAYAMVFVVIAGWIVFRFVGPATGLYSLKANLQDIPSMTQ